MDGRKIKSINHNWNKNLAKLKSVADKQETKRTKQIADLTLKRNNRCYDIIKKTARHIVNHCIENNIGTIVVGYSKGMKKDINLGTRINQQFTQISFGALREQLFNLCERYCMVYVEQEESYTSKASFLDGDFIPVYEAGNKERHSFSGERIERGLYLSKEEHRINADTNAACNILRKNNRNLQNLTMEALASPRRIKVI
jgi:IS605 OrfB family transposase